MTQENGSPPEPDDEQLPAVRKTVNQIVARNMAYYRRAAGLKQEELGERIGRAKRSVSADETSWEGGHTREFNAQEITGLAVALGIPIIAFFLPPEDDGMDVRYVFRGPGETGDLGMEDLMSAAMHDTDAETLAMNAYRRRLIGAVGEYLHASWGEILARWMENAETPEMRAEQIDELRADRHVLLRIAAKFSEAIELAEKEEGAQ